MDAKRSAGALRFLYSILPSQNTCLYGTTFFDMKTGGNFGSVNVGFTGTFGTGSFDLDIEVDAPK